MVQIFGVLTGLFSIFNRYELSNFVVLEVWLKLNPLGYWSL